MNDYIDKINLPYVNKVKDDLDLPFGQRALVIFDCFRGQITEEFTAKHFANRLIYVNIPPNCTDLFQPMDLSVNKSVKSFLTNEFESWYAAQVCDQLSGSPDNKKVKVNRSLTRMKSLGAKWPTKLYDYMKTKPEIVINSFRDIICIGT
uniref:DDE-1 domain-containing protein n=1 Tax=Magallana gigas TaxID=29159 RepID=K1RE79_MAGGI